MNDTQHRAPRFTWSLEIAAGVIVLGAMLLITANALFRKATGSQIYGTIEITQFWAMPLIGAIGIFVAQLRNQHVSADLFFSNFSPVQKKWLTVVTQVLVGTLAAAMAYYSFKNAIDAMHVGQVAGATELLAWPFVFALPLSFAGFAFIAVHRAYMAMTADTSDFARTMEDEIADELSEHEAKASPLPSPTEKETAP